MSLGITHHRRKVAGFVAVLVASATLAVAYTRPRIIRLDSELVRLERERDALQAELGPWTDECLSVLQRQAVHVDGRLCLGWDWSGPEYEGQCETLLATRPNEAWLVSVMEPGKAEIPNWQRPRKAPR